jgi:hypothetical protein
MVTNQIQTGNRGTPGKKSTSNVHVGEKIEDVLTGNFVPFSLRCSLQKSTIAKKINGKKRQVRTKVYGFVNSRIMEAMA